MTVGLLVPLIFAIGTLDLTVALGRPALPGLGKEGSGIASRLDNAMMLLSKNLVHNKLATDVGSV